MPTKPQRVKNLVHPLLLQALKNLVELRVQTDSQRFPHAATIRLSDWSQLEFSKLKLIEMLIEMCSHYSRFF